MNSHSNSRKGGIRGYAGNGQNSREVDSSSEIDKLSEELNQRITQEMNDLMSSVSSQIQRAISEAINEQKFCLRFKLLLGPDKHRYQGEDGRSRVEDQNVDLKKP